VSNRRFRPFDLSRSQTRAEATHAEAAKRIEEQRWRRARALGILGTVLAHFLLFILFRETTVPPTSSSFAAAGPAAGDLNASGGGSGMTMIEVRVQQEETPAEEVPVPVPVVEPVEVIVPEEVEEQAAAPEVAPVAPPSLPGVGGAGTGGQGGPTTGPGTDTGTGAGGGGTGDGGVAQIVPPTPRGIFIPPAGRPASARGQEITVWVFVSEVGRVDRSTVRLEPPTSDSRYNQRLIESVSEWVFDPARQAGRPVPVWYPFQIIL